MEKNFVNNVDKIIGQKLKIRRKMMGLSQDSLGKAVNLTFQQIQKYEKGVNKIVVSRLFEFARILNVPMSYFFENLNFNQEPESILYVGLSDNDENIENEFFKDNVSSKEVSSLIKSYSQITCSKIRKKILSLVKSLAHSQDNSDN